jgi:hypothetical protein
MIHSLQTETRMIRIAIAWIAMTCAAVAAMAEPVEQATVDLLATTYAFGVAGSPQGRCTVTLNAAPATSVTLGKHCRDFPVLREVTHWEPTGGASIRLLGGTPLRELSNLSPVQDATGVYLRGGFAGDNNLYELRPPQ